MKSKDFSLKLLLKGMNTIFCGLLSIGTEERNFILLTLYWIAAKEHSVSHNALLYCTKQKLQPTTMRAERCGGNALPSFRALIVIPLPFDLCVFFLGSYTTWLLRPKCCGATNKRHQRIKFLFSAGSIRTSEAKLHPSFANLSPFPLSYDVATLDVEASRQLHSEEALERKHIICSLHKSGCGRSWRWLIYFHRSSVAAGTHTGASTTVSIVATDDNDDDAAAAAADASVACTIRPPVWPDALWTKLLIIFACI